MAEPKKRRSATRQGNNRSHLALREIAVVACTNCHKPMRPHTVCIECGYYKGNLVLPQKAKKA
jgi:large subunit ribosomal protein L32